MEQGLQSCAFNYVVTAHKPTAVTHSCVGNFTAPDELNLILSKGNRLEIHTLSKGGLQGTLDVPIYGRISVLNVFRPKGAKLDLLFLLTERYKFCVLSYNNATDELVTMANGDVSDDVGRPCDIGQSGIIDPMCNLIGLHLYDGHFKVIPITDSGNLMDAFNIRLDELKVLNLGFLYNCINPTLAVLYEDTKEQRHIKTYEVRVRSKDVGIGPWQESCLDPSSTMLIPVKRTSGAIVVAEQAAIFVSKEGRLSCTFEPTSMKTYACIGDDGCRYLLGDHVGNLHLLVLEYENQVPNRIRLERLGKISQPSTLSYLDSGVVFVGSCAGDSQLIRLHSMPVDGSSPENYVEVIDTMSNIGPIVDFCVMDMDRQGQGQVITCSGTGANGSLRVIRSGTGFIEQANVDLTGVKGMWSLRQDLKDAYDAYLVLTFLGQTRVLGLDGEDELGEVDINGFDSNGQTLWCGNGSDGQLIQITSSEVRLVGKLMDLVDTWLPPQNAAITVAAGNSKQIALATNDGLLTYMEILQDSLAVVDTLHVDFEISCLDMTPSAGNVSCEVLAVGTWSMSLHLYSLPKLENVLSEPIGGDIIPRSVLLATLEEEQYVLLGLGDGALLIYRVDNRWRLLDRKKLVLGTKPILLRSITNREKNYIFAASDRPTILYSSNKKLIFSNLNVNQVNYLTTFHTKSFPDNLALVKPGCLAIGTIDDVQKLHVRTIKLNEQPRRIANQEETKTILVLISSAITSSSTRDSLRLLDDQTFETLDHFTLEEGEMGCSVNSMKLGESPHYFFIVGTAYIPSVNVEPEKGRILVFIVQHGKLNLMGQKQTRGAVYNLANLNQGLIAGINSRVQLYDWIGKEDGKWTLEPVCSHSGQVLALYFDVRGDSILVGDMMKSVQLLVFNSSERKFEVRARDFNPAWMTATMILDDQVYLGAESNYNIFSLKKNDDALREEDRCRLEIIGRFHLGEFVNRFLPGSLVMKLPDSDLRKVPTVLFGTINGVIGVIASLPEKDYKALTRLQDALRKVVKGVGGLDHSEWRSYPSPFSRSANDSTGFVDGDLIEQLLDLKDDALDAVLSGMNDYGPPETILRLVEDLSRLH